MRGKLGKKRLVLLDAHAIIHRAYHALPDFTSPSGEPTGALYGLSSMLLRIISELQPDYLAACYDLQGPTVRHEVYEAYKATRGKTEDSLVLQLTSSRRIFEAFCIPIYERQGFEADDILGTIVELTKNEEGLEVVIASGDMDTLQLIDEGRVRVYTLKKGLNDTILYDEKAVLARFQFPPEHIPDYKGLRGDPSDNIKGVPGVGDKTATDLIAGFGSLEDIYTTLKKKGDAPFLEKGIKPRMIQLLRDHEEDARFSKSLATIRRDAPILFALPDALWKDHPDLGNIRTLFDELGFRSLKPRLDALIGHEDDGGEDEEIVEDTHTEETIPQRQFREAQVMLSLLHSEFTDPGLDDLLAFSGARTFEEAYAFLERKMAEAGRVQDVYESIERPLVPVIMKMETDGVAIDQKTLETLRKTYRTELETIQKRIYSAAGKEFNVSSPKQLGEVLFDDLGLVAKGQRKTATGQRSTKESELLKIKDLHPIVGDVLEYRELQKLLSTYIEAIPPLLDANSRLHATFVQIGAATGRMASHEPNLQNIPIKDERGRAIRDAFVAEEGFVLVGLDYSQIELRIAAFLSKDEKLCEIFREGRDVHQEVASRVFGVSPTDVDSEMRRRAKVINFGILYGMGVNSLRSALNTTTADAQAFYDDYFKTFTTLAEFLESTKGFARKHGYTETLFGRRRQFPEMKSPLPYVRAQAERTAINAPIQGTQADIIKLAMGNIDSFLTKENAHDSARLILQIHDELAYEIREEHADAYGKKIKELMEDAVPLTSTNNVPIIAERKRGSRWGQMEPF